MFSSRRWGVTSPESYRFLLEYGSSSSARPPQPILASLEFDFNSDESEENVLHRFMNKIISLLHEKNEERLIVSLCMASDEEVQMNLKLELKPPTLKSISCYRTSSTGTASESLLASLMSRLDLGGVLKLKGAEGFGHFWSAPALIPSSSATASWHSLRQLNLSHCALASVPLTISEIKTLKIIRLSREQAS